jgi:hypothetical protein
VFPPRFCALVNADGGKGPSHRGRSARVGIFLRILAALAKYGKKVIDWCWANKDRIFKWIGQGAAVDWIINKIKELLGVK